MKHIVLHIALLLLPVPTYCAPYAQTTEQELFTHFGITHMIDSSWIDYLNAKLATYAYPSAYQSSATNYLFEAYPTLCDTIPYISLAALPTPVQRLNNLSAVYGTELYIKRDDLTGGHDELGNIIYGGNKVRKLEFLLAQAQALGASHVMTFGAAGSNHAVATAVHAHRLGMQPICMLKHQEPSLVVQQNLKMHLLCNSELHYNASVGNRNLEALIAWLAHLKKDGKAPYIIPTGGSNAHGALGFVNAAYELKEQINQGFIPQPTHVYLPVGSCGTAAGLLLGCKAAGLNVHIVAVSVEPDTDFETGVKKLFNKTNALLCSIDQSFPEYTYSADDITIITNFAGPNYGVCTAEGNDATRIMRELEGIQLEGTYTAKACAAMLDDAQQHHDRVILFWNTYCGADFSKQLEAHDYHELPACLHEYW
ncbi:MAG: 1-aminocyclopropane-1-carboxylate deaminase/D-cysteine desulfhydrase [Candidatus Babeliales bacterium]